MNTLKGRVSRPGSAGPPGPAPTPVTGRGLSALRQDLPASLVVFLVALPLCVGVAVASGVPAELGLVTGIVGGIVVGALPGSSLQVSGPAVSLTVLVLEAVRAYGLAALGVIVLATGLLQLLMGALRWGRWFRAISVSVVEGMLAGIGLVLIAGQLYSLTGTEAPAAGLDKIAGLPGMLIEALGSPGPRASLLLGAGTIAVLVLWKRLPAKVRVVPAPSRPSPSPRSPRRRSPCPWPWWRSRGFWTPYGCRAPTTSRRWSASVSSARSSRSP